MSMHSKVKDKAMVKQRAKITSKPIPKVEPVVEAPKPTEIPKTKKKRR